MLKSFNILFTYDIDNEALAVISHTVSLCPQAYFRIDGRELTVIAVVHASNDQAWHELGAAYGLDADHRPGSDPSTN